MNRTRPRHRSPGAPLPPQDGFCNYFGLTPRMRQLLGFALGRGVQLSDKPLIEDIAAELKSGEGRIGTVIERIVTSPQFRDIRSL